MKAILNLLYMLSLHLNKTKSLIFIYLNQDLLPFLMLAIIVGRWSMTETPPIHGPRTYTYTRTYTRTTIHPAACFEALHANAQAFFAKVPNRILNSS